VINRTTRTVLATTLSAAALAAAVSGCGAPAPHTTATSAATGARVPADTPHVTGTRLKALLPGAAQLATGVTIASATDSANTWTPPAQLPAPTRPNAACAEAPDISADILTADYRAAYATEVLDHAGNTLQILLAEANPGDAAKQLAEVRAFAARCASFTAPNASGTGTTAGLTVDTFANLGDEALRIRVTGQTQQPEVVLIRVGEAIAAVSDTNLAENEAATIPIAHYLADRLTGKTA
jgi:hypothetical protein